MVAKISEPIIIIVCLVVSALIIVGGVVIYKKYIISNNSKEEKPTEIIQNKENPTVIETKNISIGSSNPLVVSTEKYGDLEIRFHGNAEFDVIDSTKYNENSEEFKNLLTMNIESIISKYNNDVADFHVSYLKYITNIVDESLEKTKSSYDKFGVNNLKIEISNLIYTQESISKIREIDTTEVTPASEKAN